MSEPSVPRDDRWAFAAYKFMPRGNPANMTDVQKSVWVEPWRGCITEQDVTIVKVPSALKPEILSHLRVVYGIEASSVYNDLSGLIRDQDRLRDYEAEWYAGLRAYHAGHYEAALGFFAQYEQLYEQFLEEPESSLEYYRGISYWNMDRKEEALAAMARLRRRIPNDARAFPEEMESVYAERQRGPGADRRRIDSDGGAPAAEVFPGFRIQEVSEDGTPTRTGRYIKVTHETGASHHVILHTDADGFVSFPELTPETGGTWQLSLNPIAQRHYQDVELMGWPIRETLVMKATDGTTTGVRVEIESLQYTYEPGIMGPFVTYPARTEDAGGSTA